VIGTRIGAAIAAVGLALSGTGFAQAQWQWAAATLDSPSRIVGVTLDGDNTSLSYFNKSGHPLWCEGIVLPAELVDEVHGYYSTHPDSWIELNTGYWQFDLSPALQTARDGGEVVRLWSADAPGANLPWKPIADGTVGKMYYDSEWDNWMRLTDANFTPGAVVRCRSGPIEQGPEYLEIERYSPGPISLGSVAVGDAAAGSLGSTSQAVGSLDQGAGTGSFASDSVTASVSTEGAGM
jgi:hypothetical protein